MKKISHWLRLWHDMPNDPKWKTIARVSGQPIALVQSVYLHLMVDASRNVTRGHVTVTEEDLASALEVTDEAIASVFAAMRGRVLDGTALSGWDARQPKYEDHGDEQTGAKSAAERKRAQREREALARLEAEALLLIDAGHDESRDVTTEEKREEENISLVIASRKNDCPYAEIVNAFIECCTSLPPVRHLNDQRKRALNARWLERLKAKDYDDQQSGIAWWRDFFLYVERSDFLTGRKTGNRAGSFDWLMKPANMLKVMEGNYD